MNKRILDGGALWKSDKLARIQPEWMRAEYANWIPLALANGVFEADTRRTWATVYSYNRPDITFDDAEEIKREFCRVGLLFLWPDEPSGKTWGFFVGIDKVGRLPPQSRVNKKHAETGPAPPADALRSYIELTRAKPIESSMVSQWLANGCLGSGSGSGIGSGSGEPVKAQALSEPLAPGICEELFAFWNESRGALPKALTLTKARRGKILTRIKSDLNFPKTFRDALLKARQTPFCCGATGGSWRVSFDWMIENDENAVKVLEGKYDGGKGGADGKPPEPLKVIHTLTFEEIPR
jgi:hypothetical protein